MEGKRYRMDKSLKLLVLALLISVNVYAAPPQRQATYTSGEVISSSDVTANENVIYNYLQAGVDTYSDNTIVNADINTAANIQSDKLNLTAINQNIANTGTFANTGNATVTGTLTVSSTVTANSVTYATLPAGAIAMWGTNTAPDGWLICDGTAVSRTTYSGLFAVIGTTYGTGDGSTTFNLPNVKGKNVIGRDSSIAAFDTLAETGGEQTHTMTTAELVAHTHDLSLKSVNSGGTAQIPQDSDGTGATTTDTTASTGSSTAFNVLDPYIILNFIIKY